MAVETRRGADEATINRDDDVLGDIATNAMSGIDDEVACRFRLGPPVVVSDGSGRVVDLSATSVSVWSAQEHLRAPKVCRTQEQDEGER
jgi:hypothetical protein